MELEEDGRSNWRRGTARASTCSCPGLGTSSTIPARLTVYHDFSLDRSHFIVQRHQPAAPSTSGSSWWGRAEGHQLPADIRHPRGDSGQGARQRQEASAFFASHLFVVGRTPTAGGAGSPGSGSTNEGPTTAMATRHFESSWVRRRQGEGGGKPASGSRLAPTLSHFLWRPLPGSPSIHLAHALDTFP